MPKNDFDDSELESTRAATAVESTAAVDSVTPESIDTTTTGASKADDKSGDSNDLAAPTDVNSVVITAAEAILYSGPGKDYPVIATALGSANYPVGGISKDEQWWRLTCYDDSAFLIEECWVSADLSVAMPTDSAAMTSESNIKPYLELTFDFLRAVQAGLTAAGSEPYLSSDLQQVVQAGRPLPTLFGVRDAFPSFVLTDFSDPRTSDEKDVRVKFNYDSPNYAIVHLIREEGEWQIDRVAAHNLVKTYGTEDLMRAESVIVDYFEALTQGDLKAARDLLASEIRESTSQQDLSQSVQGLEKLRVSTMQPVRSSADQLIYYVRLLAEVDRLQPSSENTAWQNGDNSRWLTMVKDGNNWLIANFVYSPLLSEIESWQRINVLPINMTLDIPADWARAGLEWAWSPNSLGMPGIGVAWTELGEYGGDEVLLPRYRREDSSRPVDLGWAHGTQYTFELMGGPGEDAIAAETHMIVQTGRRAYDFYGKAPTLDDLDDLRPILQQMVAAVTINDPQASAYNSVEAVVNFLAALQRDGTGASSSPFLSEKLRPDLGEQSPLLDLLGVDKYFEHFNASWIENPAPGQALVGVTLNFDNSTEELIFTVKMGSDDVWLITQIEPAES